MRSHNKILMRFLNDSFLRNWNFLDILSRNLNHNIIFSLYILINIDSLFDLFVAFSLNDFFDVNVLGLFDMPLYNVVHIVSILNDVLNWVLDNDFIRFLYDSLNCYRNLFYYLKSFIGWICLILAHYNNS
jgi:hypothetical protein